MTRITVNVQGDVQKHRLMCLTKWHDPADEVNVRAAHDGEVPEFVSTSDLSDGDKVIINITGNPTWDVEAGEDLPAGIPVACGEDGVVVATSPSYARLIGYTANAASAGSVVKVVKQFIVNRNWLDGVEETDSEPESGGDGENEIESMTVAQLRDEAEKEGIEGYSSMKKADLIDALKG